MVGTVFASTPFMDAVGIGGLVGILLALVALFLLIGCLIRERREKAKEYLDHIGDELAVREGKAPRSSTAYFQGDLSTEAYLRHQVPGGGSNYGMGFEQAMPGGNGALSRVNPLMAAKMDGEGYMDIMY